MELITDNGGGNIDYLLGRFIVLICENLEHKNTDFLLHLLKRQRIFEAG
jgi:hypothetical protein